MSDEASDHDHDHDYDRITSLISHRCGDILTPAEIAAISAALAGRAFTTDAIPGEIAERIIDVLGEMDARMAALEKAAA